MNISTWRSGLKAWLQKYVVIDSWELRSPIEYNKVNGYLPPLQGINYASDQLGSCTAMQDIYLTWRFRGDANYADLPLGTLEQIYAMVARKLVLGYGEIASLLDFRMVPIENCIQVEEYGDGDDADWLVRLVFSMELTWTTEVTLLPGESVEPIVPIQVIDTALYAERLRSQNHLDPATRDKYGKVQAKKQP